MPARSFTNGSVTWSNRAGQQAVQSTTIVWAEQDCRFQIRPRVDFSLSGGTSMAEYWGEFELSNTYTSEDNCECVIVTIRFRGRFKPLKFAVARLGPISFRLPTTSLGPIETSYEVCANNTARRLT